MSYPPEAWERLGRLLVSRRVQLDPAYRNRQKFIAATGLHERLVSDLENARRFSYRTATMDAVEAAYGLAAGGLERALQGGELGIAHSGSVRLHAEGSLTVNEHGVSVTEYEADWYYVVPGGRDSTADGFPIPPKPKGLEMPPGFDPTSLPRHEVEMWLLSLPMHERGWLVAQLRRRRQDERDAALPLWESSGPDGV